MSEHELASVPPVAVAVDAPTDSSLAEGGQLHVECPAYVDLARRALTLGTEGGFSAVEALDVVRRTGPDNEGRAVFMFFPSRLPADVDIEHVTLYAIWLMHPVVVLRGEQYTAVWVCNNSVESRLGVRWFRRTYWSVPYAYHKQMAALCIVHPSVTVRFVLFALSYLVKHSFWEKINYADRLEVIDENLLLLTLAPTPRQARPRPRPRSSSTRISPCR